MKEVSVIVKQNPGVVSWNFEEIKKDLELSLMEYENTVYDDDSIKSAKTDVADLRALAKTIEDRRKEVKEKCLEPYSIIEKQAKELVALIDKPIAAINEQVRDYEKRRKEKARAEIEAYWIQKVTVLPEKIWQKAYDRIYDSRWENATATKKSWRDGIDSGIQKIAGDIETIRSFSSKYESDMLQVFYNTLSLQDAIRKMNNLKDQEQRILEQQRREHEEREARERAEAEKAAAEQAAREQAVPTLKNTQKMVHPENVEKPAVSAPEIPRTPEPSEIRQTPDPECVYSGGQFATLRIIGTPQQIVKIKDYIRFTGASFEEV